MISVESIVAKQLPKIDASAPIIKNSLVRFLKYLFHESEFNQFEKSYPHLKGLDFVEQVLDYFEFGSFVNDRDICNIPTEGKVVAIANHPIGSLDGLALLKILSAVRTDVKVVANELLWAIKPLRPMLLPVNNMAGRTPKENMRAIEQHVENGGALLIFPAGEVSRLSPKGVMDGRWRSGFLRFARKNQAPILPIHVDGKNSMFFYALSMLAKPISTLWLIDEMFKQRQRDIRIRVGRPITFQGYTDLNLEDNRLIGLFKKHVYGLAKKKNQDIFKPAFESVAHPENRQQLKQSMTQCELLGETNDGKHIYCYRHTTDTPIMREIGRLRELSFRAVGEGSGQKRDIDKYDSFYDHVVLWDKEQLEIVGAYRMVQINEVKQSADNLSLYSSTLFDLDSLPHDVQQQGLELGRSFVQPAYWGKRSLDYLWQGIGAYLKQRPNIRFLLGAVSISNELNTEAKSSLVRFYQTYFGCPNAWVQAKTPFVIQQQDGLRFNGDNYEQEFKLLKAKLKQEGTAIPTLYKQYSELCDPSGVKFCAFNVDPDFCDCIDGFVVVDITKMKESKKQRYLS
jgi:putative hemolysin